MPKPTPAPSAPSDSTTPTAAAVSLAEGGKAPVAVCYMPAGESVIFARVDGEAQEKRVVADEAAAGRLQADLAQMLKETAEGKRPRPCLYFDHKQGEAAGFPGRFYWEEGKGIMLEISEWTKSGREKVEGKGYGYISPAFRVSRADGQVMGLVTGGVEVASLVNDPAFRAIPPVLDVAAAEAEPEQGVAVVNAAEAEEGEKISPRKDVAPVAEAEYHEEHPNQRISMDLDKLKEMLGLPAEADEAAVLDAVAKLVSAKDERQAERDELQKKNDELQASCDKKDEQLKAERVAAAAAFTDGLIRTGALAPKDEQRIRACQALYEANPEQARIAFAAAAAAGPVRTQSVLASEPEAGKTAAGQSLEDMLKGDFVS